MSQMMENLIIASKIVMAGRGCYPVCQSDHEFLDAIRHIVFVLDNDCIEYYYILGIFNSISFCRRPANLMVGMGKFNFRVETFFEWLQYVGCDISLLHHWE